MNRAICCEGLVDVRARALTTLELLAIVVVVALLAVFLIPLAIQQKRGPGMSQAVSNARQIHIATAGAAADANAQSDSSIGWPADLASRPVDAGTFIRSLVDGGYLRFPDLKVFGTGEISYPGSGNFEVPKHCGYKIFNVSEKDPPSTIFLTTRNVLLDLNSNTSSQDVSAAYQSREAVYVVFRKGGDGQLFFGFKRQSVPFGTLPAATPRQLPLTGTLPSTTSLAKRSRSSDRR